MITLTNKGHVYAYDISVEILNKEQLKMFKAPEQVETSINLTPRKIIELSNIVQMAAGERHVIALDKEG